VRVIPQPTISGEADLIFWQFLREGEFRLQRCQECGRWRYPPAALCDQCLSEEAEWLPVQGEGRLLSWATFHHRYFSILDPPYVVGAVLLPEGPLVCASMRGAGQEHMELDRRVVAVIDDAILENGEPWAIFDWQLIDP
jgi:uncharacterized protein